ncbi:mitochondrial 50S ribosomal protein L28-like protein [Dentipellis sp. KUC8613]|nr:mitochondrial 50S ribosomal protein L28-like protein [Dentipellis sp. KUC8613]
MFPSLPTLSAAARVLTGPFKRAQQGLYHGAMKQYGNNVPFSKHKTRRTWLPNVHSKRLFSDALGVNVRVKLSTRALKTINKYGSFDQYVLQTKSELLGWEGMRLRMLVREALERKARAEPLASPPSSSSP